VALNVLYLISTLNSGGPVKVLWGIVRHLDRRKYRPVIVTLSPEPENSIMRTFQEAGVETHQLNMSRAASLFTGRKQIHEAISDTQADVVHCHGIRATLLAIGSSRRPLTATLHCNLGDYYRLAYGRLPGAAMAWLEYRALRKFNLVAAVSDNVDKTARSHGILPLIIRNGVDLGTYFPPRNDAEMKFLREKLGWPAESVVVLHTGVLNAGKQPVEAIEGFLDARFSRKCILVFAGDGPLRDRCAQAARGSDRIVFLGWRTDVADLMRAADILISNSASEGTPLTMLEGCASGLTVVATDIPAHRSIQGMFPDQVVLSGDELRKSLEQTVARFTYGRWLRTTPPREALEAISDRTMSEAYQHVYSNLAAQYRA